MWYSVLNLFVRKHVQIWVEFLYCVCVRAENEPLLLLLYAVVKTRQSNPTVSGQWSQVKHIEYIYTTQTWYHAQHIRINNENGRKSLCRHPCWCNRWPDTDRKFLIFGFDSVLHIHTSQQGPFFLRLFFW